MMTFSEDTSRSSTFVPYAISVSKKALRTKLYIDIVIFRNLHQSLECLDQRIKDVISKEKEQGTGNYKVCY